MYQDSFSCKMAFVASALRGAAAWPLEANFSSLPGTGRTTSERSLTMSKVRGFSRRKSSSKYTVGIVESGGGPWACPLLGRELERRDVGVVSMDDKELSEVVDARLDDKPGRL